MIGPLASPDGWLDFLRGFDGDKAFSVPRGGTAEERMEMLREACRKPDRLVLGASREGEKTGLFYFLLLEDERYLEMLSCLTRDENACRELGAYLSARFPGYQADFVYSPEITPLTALLRQKGASFCTEQQKMVFAGHIPSIDLGCVEPLSEKYLGQYCAMHSADVYWTGEKTAARPDLFRVFIAREGETVVGYLDATVGHDENEPVDVRVQEPFRCRGWGRKLLVAALAANRPHGMRLHVDVDNAPAIGLYTSVGFVKAEGENSLTVTWDIPPAD